MNAPNKKAISYSVIALLAIVMLAITYYKQKSTSQDSSVTKDIYVEADTDDFDASLPINTTLPKGQFIYQGVVHSDVMQFTKSNGLVIVINRSLDWCPFCKRQAIDIEAIYNDLHEYGIGFVIISYDSPEIQQQFVEKHNLTYAVISDIDGKTFAAWNVLHQDYPKGHRHYGLPYAGTLFIDRDGKIKEKIFIKDYVFRVRDDKIKQMAITTLATPQQTQTFSIQ